MPKRIEHLIKCGQIVVEVIEINLSRSNVYWRGFIVGKSSK